VQSSGNNVIVVRRVAHFMASTQHSLYRTYGIQYQSPTCCYRCVCELWPRRCPLQCSD